MRGRARRVNIEIDMLARYVARLAEFRPIMKNRKDQAAAAEKIKAHLLILEARFYGDCATSCAVAPSPPSSGPAPPGSACRCRVPWNFRAPSPWRMRPGAIDGYVALGCVLRGETTHYDIVANESARGIMELTLEGLCIGNGILTCENEAQAWARAKVDEMDKGGGAAEAALAMIRFHAA